MEYGDLHEGRKGRIILSTNKIYTCSEILKSLGEDTLKNIGMKIKEISSQTQLLRR
jgi:hypothetical protein